MDAEGIDQAMLFPSIGLYFSAVDEASTAVALARAYNDWLASYCAADPLPAVRGGHAADARPGGGGGRAAPGRRRAPLHRRLRPAQSLRRTLPVRSGQRLVWSAAEELGVPIGIHEGSSVIVPTLGADRPFNPLILHATSHAFEEMLACAQLIAFGVLERHPDLQVVFLESGGGWVPFWLERLDEQAESFGGFCPEMRSARVSTSPGSAPSATRSTSGPCRPSCPTSAPSGSSGARTIRTTTPPSPVPCTSCGGRSAPSPPTPKVLGLNAQRIYRLPPHRTGPSAVVDAYFAAITTGTPRPSTTVRRRRRACDRPAVHRGVDEIARFYAEGAFGFDDLRPRRSAYDVHGVRVEVAIDLHIGGTDTMVVDEFIVAGDKISRLSISALPSVLGSPNA